MTKADQTDSTPTPAANRLDPKVAARLDHLLKEPRARALAAMELPLCDLAHVASLLEHVGTSDDPIDPHIILPIADNIRALNRQLLESWETALEYQREREAAEIDRLGKIAPPQASAAKSLPLTGAELSDLQAYRALLKTAAAGVLEMLDRTEADGAG